MIRKHTLAHDPKVTKALEALPALYETDGAKGDRPAVKLFDMAGSAFWVIWEYDAETETGFGLADLGLGFPELGYVSVTELKALTPSYRIEKDAMVETMVEGYESRQTEVPDYLLKEDSRPRQL